MTVAERKDSASPAKTRATTVTGMLVILGCMAACSLPLLAGGTVVAGIGALLAGWWPAAAAVLLILAGAAWFYIVRRRSAAKARAAGSGCECGGSC